MTAMVAYGLEPGGAVGEEPRARARGRCGVECYRCMRRRGAAVRSEPGVSGGGDKVGVGLMSRAGAEPAPDFPTSHVEAACILLLQAFALKEFDGVVEDAGHDGVNSFGCGADEPPIVRVT